MSHSTWTWTFVPEGTEVDLEGQPTEFTNQSDAESWLGEAWRQLAAAGVTGVTLVQDGTEVYGPMPLSE